MGVIVANSCRIVSRRNITLTGAGLILQTRSTVWSRNVTEKSPKNRFDVAKLRDRIKAGWTESRD
jgi:hypothetical protein